MGATILALSVLLKSTYKLVLYHLRSALHYHYWKLRATEGFRRESSCAPLMRWYQTALFASHQGRYDTFIDIAAIVAYPAASLNVADV